MFSCLPAEPPSRWSPGSSASAPSLLARTEHRRRAEPTRGSEKLQQKIDRILGRIEEGKDKKWLQRQLEHAREPSLEQRIYETLEGLPLDSDKEALRRFAAACAEKRNEISHYGGRRHEGKYDNELEDLHKKSVALSNLNHILLLREIGIDDLSLNAIAHRGLRPWILIRFRRSTLSGRAIRPGLFTTGGISVTMSLA